MKLFKNFTLEKHSNILPKSSRFLRPLELKLRFLSLETFTFSVPPQSLRSRTFQLFHCWMIILFRMLVIFFYEKIWGIQLNKQAQWLSPFLSVHFVFYGILLSNSYKALQKSQNSSREGKLHETHETQYHLLQHFKNVLFGKIFWGEGMTFVNN